MQEDDASAQSRERLPAKRESFWRAASDRVKVAARRIAAEMKVTVNSKAVSVGTEMKIEQEGVPDVIPAEVCYLGWQAQALQARRA